jgi:hypothetical protein
MFFGIVYSHNYIFFGNKLCILQMNALNMPNPGAVVPPQPNAGNNQVVVPAAINQVIIDVAPEVQQDEPEHAWPALSHPMNMQGARVDHVFQRVDWRGRIVSLALPSLQVYSVLQQELVEYKAVEYVDIPSNRHDEVIMSYGLPLAGTMYSYCYRKPVVFGVTTTRWYHFYESVIYWILQFIVWFGCISWPTEVVTREKTCDKILFTKSEMCPLYLKDTMMCWWESGALKKDPRDGKIVTAASVYLWSLLVTTITIDSEKHRVYKCIHNRSLEIALANYQCSLSEVTNLESFSLARFARVAMKVPLQRRRRWVTPLRVLLGGVCICVVVAPIIWANVGAF